MSPLSRRTVLTLGGTALCTGLAGCATLGEASPADTRLHELTVANHESEPHTVHVLLLEDGEPVYMASREVEGRTDPDRVPGGEFEGYPTEAGSYVLYAWRDDQPRPEWRRFDFSEYDVDCVEIAIHVGMGDVPDSYVSIWRSFNCASGGSDAN